jgi:3-hydroxyisobutyrate dehydrogenase-like beta-hydroxyacid dehydrogenase
MATTSRIPSVGFVGLGVMGEPMATHLSKAGHPLALFDVRAGQAARLAATFADACAPDSPAEVARRSDIVITMVPNGEIVRDLVAGGDGLLAGFRPGSLLLDTSSSEPWLTRESGRLLAERGIAMVDAPVSGAQWGAQAASWSSWSVAGGRRQLRPLFDVMGRAVFHLGPLGAGHAMKCLNNLVTAINFLAVSEGLVIGKRHGLDPSVMTDVLNESTGMSWVSQTHVKQRIVSRSFDDPFKLALMLKDIGIATQLARSVDVPAPIRHWPSSCGRRRAGNDPAASVSEMARWVETMTATDITAALAVMRQHRPRCACITARRRVHRSRAGEGAGERTPGLRWC